MIGKSVSQKTRAWLKSYSLVFILWFVFGNTIGGYLVFRFIVNPVLYMLQDAVIRAILGL